MVSKFHEHAIITGVADAFCLVCLKYLKLKDVELHIAEVAHQNAFQATSYVEKYKHESIRKVKLGYYCELCNLMLQTLAKTGIHVNETAHVNNKNNQHLKNSDEGVIAFDDILIEKNAWHGLSEGSCLICNMDYSDENNHKNDAKHILNLIQSKFEIYENKFVYRKVDGDSYNCLICNIIITNESKNTHCNQSEHEKKYLQCQENKKKIIAVDTLNNVVKISPGVKASSNELKQDLVRAPSENSNTDILPYKKQTEEKNYDEENQSSEELKKAMAYAKQNNLIYTKNHAYCKCCDITISPSLMTMKKHVQSLSHKEQAKMKTNNKLVKVRMPDFINNITSVQNLFHHDMIINDEYCISILSLLMIRDHEGRLRCHVCEVTIDPSKIEEHKHSIRHIHAMQNTPVLADFKSEFVREIRYSVYHCGYCNTVEENLDHLKNHLSSVNHNDKKIEAKRRLDNYLPEIQEDKQQKKMFLEFLKRFP